MSFKLKLFCIISAFVAMGLAQTQANRAPLSDQEKLILKQVRGLRDVPDEDRGAVTKQVALDIRRLPADDAKVGIAQALASLATEGDFGHDTLQEVATTLAAALGERPSRQNETYSELAQLVRYEHVAASVEGPQFKAAMSKLNDEDRDREKANFTLTDLSGKTWTLKDLIGHVVLVNFWATWCPPCRKEMPDLNVLYQRFQPQGLIVLAISDEDSKTVTAYLGQHAVVYPILLDPARKVNELFHVDGIPKTYIFNRQGALAAQAIDMRTQAQFLAMLGRAGLQ